MIERISRPGMAVAYRGDRPASGANINCGSVVPLTSFGFSFHKNVDDRRFQALARALDLIQPEIERESERLRQARKRMTDCAAFCLEATENGDRGERLSAKLVILSHDLAANQARELLLEQQKSFLARIRAGLPRILHSQRM